MPGSVVKTPQVVPVEEPDFDRRRRFVRVGHGDPTICKRGDRRRPPVASIRRERRRRPPSCARERARRQGRATHAVDRDLEDPDNLVDARSLDEHRSIYGGERRRGAAARPPSAVGASNADVSCVAVDPPSSDTKGGEELHPWRMPMNTPARTTRPLRSFITESGSETSFLERERARPIPS